MRETHAAARVRQRRFLGLLRFPGVQGDEASIRVMTFLT